MSVSKKTLIKSIFSHYSVAIVATLLLILILAVLIGGRLAAIASVSDISKINPLIVADGDQLLAANDKGEPVVVVNDSANKDNTLSSTGSQGNNSGSSSSPQLGTPSPTSSTSPSPSPTTSVTPRPLFTATIDSLTYTVKRNVLLVLCSEGYHISATIRAFNGDGNVHYEWSLDGSAKSSGDFTFNGQSTKGIAYDFTGDNNTHTVALTITTANNTDTKQISVHPDQKC